MQDDRGETLLHVTSVPNLSSAGESILFNEGMKGAVQFSLARRKDFTDLLQNQSEIAGTGLTCTIVCNRSRNRIVYTLYGNLGVHESLIGDFSDSDAEVSGEAVLEDDQRASSIPLVLSGTAKLGKAEGVEASIQVEMKSDDAGRFSARWLPYGAYAFELPRMRLQSIDAIVENFPVSFETVDGQTYLLKSVVGVEGWGKPIVLSKEQPKAITRIDLARSPGDISLRVIAGASPAIKIPLLILQLGKNKEKGEIPFMFAGTTNADGALRLPHCPSGEFAILGLLPDGSRFAITCATAGDSRKLEARIASGARTRTLSFETDPAKLLDRKPTDWRLYAQVLGPFQDFDPTREGYEVLSSRLGVRQWPGAIKVMMDGSCCVNLWPGRYVLTGEMRAVVPVEQISSGRFDPEKSPKPVIISGSFTLDDRSAQSKVRLE